MPYVAQQSTGLQGAKTMAQRAREAREDPRVMRTRNLIRDALFTLLEQKPFSDISVQDIAERATINRATFYAHFQDKFALLEDLVRMQYRRYLAQHDPLAASDISSLLESISFTTFEQVRAHNKCKLDKEFEPQLERAMQDELYQFLVSALDEASALVVSSAVIGTTLQWRAGRYRDSSDELIKRLVSVLSGGVRLQQRTLEAVS